MIKAEELRIGNLIFYHDKQIVVEGVSLNKIYHAGGFDSNILSYEPFQPIPITEEWLLKLGLTESKPKGKFYLNHMGFHLQYDEYANDWNVFPSVNSIAYIASINHVHQLQNLFHAIKGEELTIKE